MNIFYLLTLLILLTILFLFPKSSKVLNGLTWIVFTISVYLCFNLLSVFILYFIKIPSSLFVLGIINLVISSLIFYFKICDKDLKGKKVIQKYSFNILEVVCFLLIIGIVSGIGYCRFNNLLTINYETTDPSLHHKIALKYAEVESLLDKTNSVDEMYGDFNRAMTGSYINGGIFIRVLNFMNSYNAFIIYDVFMYLISALLFYVTGLELRKKKGNVLIIFILSLFYMLGYPLNNLLFGFSYLGIGVYIINLIFITVYMLKNKDFIKIRKYLILLMFLFNYGLFFSYYLFIPFVYLGLGLYLIYHFLKKKINFKDTLRYGIITLIIPFVFGFSYFILAGYLSTNEVKEASAIAAEGYIYRDLLSNFILIMPLFLYSFITQIKRKEKSFNIFIVSTLFLFIGLIFYLGMKGSASSYYYYKLYYPLWLIIYLNIFEILNFDSKDSKTVLISNLLFIIGILGIAGIKLEDKVRDNNILFSPTLITRGITDIYVWNGNRILEERPVFSVDEFEVVNASQKYHDDCVNDNSEFPMVSNYLQKLWYYSIYDVVPLYKHSKGWLSQFYEEGFDYSNWKHDDNSKCLIVLNSSNPKEDNVNYVNMNSNRYDILFKNKEGFIIIKK